jgi:class 3 adenylate cyclase/tetratricopeptide (TPR) repeat protein
VQPLSIDFAAYFPTWVIRSLCERWVAEDRPFAMKRRVSALFLDVADFSEKTGKFASRGARGAEDLSTILNGCFSVLTDTINDYGGDIVAFAGDGLVVLWEESDVRTAALLATNCALAFQDALANWARSTQHDLRVRVSIEVGEVFLCRVGGVDARWHYLVAGSPVGLACAAYHKAEIGQVILCPAARGEIGELCVGKIVDDVFLQVTSVLSPIRGAPSQSDASFQPKELRPLLPKVVLDRADFGEGRWLAEFRKLTIVSIRLGNLGQDDNLLDKLQKAILAIQNVSARFEGTILNIVTTDKGIHVTLVFGLPPLGHSDDALRAIEAAWAVRQILKSHDVTASIGVATGRLFCGEYGGQTRREYSILGQTINLSARLMVVAENEVLCDAVTSTSVDSRVTFSALRSVRLKGWTRPVPVYRPEAMLGPQGPRSPGHIIGRDAERAILDDALRSLLNHEGQLVIVQGEAGIGKSRLLADLIEKAKSKDCYIYQGFATAIEQPTLYFAWREVLLRLIGSAPNVGAAHVQEKLVAALSGEPQLLSWVPLLDDVIHVGFAQTELTLTITGSARASSIEQVIVHLLRQSASRGPTILIFDDQHWFDDASTALLRSVTRRLPEILVVASRRSTESTPMFNTGALEVARVVTLDALAEDAVAELVRRRLGVSSFPAELQEFVHRHAGGNPFFCEELLLALRDTGAIELDRDSCRVSGDLAAASHSALSASVEGAIVSRIDALPPAHQMALKVASAIGVEFSSKTLQIIYPNSATASDVSALLDRLVALELLRVQNCDGQTVYDFRHAIIRGVTYDQLSFAQRRDLHREIADCIERLNQLRLEPFYAQLALHRELADQPNLAIEYLDRAAEQALRNYANRDAIGYATRATKLADSAGAVIDDHRRSVWEVTFGDAHHELRDYETASRHYEDALRLLGRRAPATKSQIVQNLLGDVAWQICSRILGASLRPASDAQREELRQAAHVYERLSEEYFYRNDSLHLLHGTLASLNLAERCGSTAETISGYNGLALGLGMSGMKGAARFYSRRAFQLARERGGKPEVARANLVAGVLASGLGEGDHAKTFALEAAAAFRELGDQARLQNTLVGLVFEYLIHSDLARAESLLNELSGSDLKEASDTIRAWRLCARAIIDTIKGSADPALLLELRSVVDGKHAPADRLLCFGVLASAYERRGDSEAALEAAERGFDVLEGCRVVWAAYGLYGAAGVVGALIAHWERGARARSSDAELEAKARRACDLLYGAARTSPVCRPAALLLRGSASFLSGNIQRARRDWRRAVSCAESLDMQYFAGLAWFQIGESSAQKDPLRDFALSRAEKAFHVAGAITDLARVRVSLID